MFEVQVYTTESGQTIFKGWLRKLSDTRAQAAIIRRINRMQNGNFGDCKPCRDGVREVRIDYGPGYRVYFAQTGKTVVLLLCGGDKRTQSSDITKACTYWRDWQKRSQEKEVAW